jgi:hypothetical protein
LDFAAIIYWLEGKRSWLIPARQMAAIAD